MRILHIISQHPESTGSGIYVLNMIREAAINSHQNFLLAGVTGDDVECPDVVSNESFFPVSFATDTLNFALPGMSDVMPYPSSRFMDLNESELGAYVRGFEKTIKKAVQKSVPDIIHSHHLWLVTALVRKLFTDIPLVVSCHSTDLRQFEQCTHLQERVVPYCRKIDRVLALSEDQRERIVELFAIEKNKIDIVGGGFDQSLFVHTIKRKAPPVQLLYAGKLSFAKGVDWLLETVMEMGDDDFHLHLVGAGTGKEASHCLELADQLKDSVTVHGRLSQQELAKLMGRCHIFILPSFYEGLPLVLLESLASGCRIITTNLAGCKSLLKNASVDLVSFVELPPLLGIDQPAHEDRALLIVRLQEAMNEMIGRVKKTESPDISDTLDMAEVAAITTSSSWKTVFERVCNSYESARAVEQF